uniref:Uncharacterized protein n=1 Tax=Rhizophora mucronata TaxID=61149 RepID=A0A2P2N4M5_RHIMU
MKGSLTSCGLDD